MKLEPMQALATLDATIRKLIAREKQDRVMIGAGLTDDELGVLEAFVNYDPQTSCAHCGTRLYTDDDKRTNSCPPCAAAIRRAYDDEETF